MLSQGGIDIHRFHVRREVAYDVVYGRALGVGTSFHLLRTVVFHRGRNHHAIDIYLRECLLIFVGCFCIASTTSARTTIGHQGTYMIA